MAGQAGGLDTLNRMHDPAGQADFANLGKSRIVAGAAIDDAAHIDRAIDDAGLGAVKPVEIAKPLTGMAGGAGGADLAVVVPMAEGFGRGIGMGRPEPVGDCLVIVDIDLGRGEGPRLRQGKGDDSLVLGCVGVGIGLGKCLNRKEQNGDQNQGNDRP